MVTADTPAKRAYLVRLACGDGFKSPEPMAAFAVRLTRQKRGAWDSAKVSRVESGERKLTLDDVETYVRVDPLKRSPAWLAFGETAAPAPLPDLEPQIAGTLSPEQKEASRRRRAARKKNTPHGRTG